MNWLGPEPVNNSNVGKSVGKKTGGIVWKYYRNNTHSPWCETLPILREIMKIVWLCSQQLFPPIFAISIYLSWRQRQFVTKNRAGDREWFIWLFFILQKGVCLLCRIAANRRRIKTRGEIEPLARCRVSRFKESRPGIISRNRSWFKNSRMFYHWKRSLGTGPTHSCISLSLAPGCEWINVTVCAS